MRPALSQLHRHVPTPNRPTIRLPTSAVGTSFYKPCFPAGTVDVSFSATAMHWLSSVPCTIPDALHSACSEDPTALAAFEAQAAKDWEHIMKLREVLGDARSSNFTT